MLIQILQPQISELQLSQNSDPIPIAPVEPEIVQSDEISTRTPEIGVIVGLAILIFFLLRVFRVLRDDESVTKHRTIVAPCPAAPCPSCQFFSKNVYLKCAVRPTDVLTDRAIDCADYCPHPQKQADQLPLLTDRRTERHTDRHTDY